jgi:hypothetical protein
LSFTSLLFGINIHIVYVLVLSIRRNENQRKKTKEREGSIVNIFGTTKLILDVYEFKSITKIHLRYFLLFILLKKVD